MNLAQQTNAKMLEAAANAERVYVKLVRARARGASDLCIRGLEAAYDQHNHTVNTLWDAWNDAMLVERLARI